MQGAILAHGQGTRLRSVTGGTPKTLIEVGARSILERTLSVFHDVGIDQVTIIRNSEGAILDRFASDANGMRVRVKVVEPQGSLNAFAATEALSDEGVLVVDGDLLFDPADLMRMVAFAETQQGRTASLLVGITTEPGRDTAPVRVQISPGLRVMSIGRGLEGTYTLSGMYVCRRSAYVGVQEILDTGVPSLARYLSWVVNRAELIGFPVGAVQDIDYPEDLEAAEELIASNYRRSTRG